MSEALATSTYHELVADLCVQAGLQLATDIAEGFNQGA
jgi:hypothetical protein